MTLSKALISEEKCSLHRARCLSQGTQNFYHPLEIPYKRWTVGCQVHEVCRFIATLWKYDILQKTLSNSTEILISLISGQIITTGTQKYMCIDQDKKQNTTYDAFWMASQFPNCICRCGSNFLIPARRIMTTSRPNFQKRKRSDIEMHTFRATVWKSHVIISTEDIRIST